MSLFFDRGMLRWLLFETFLQRDGPFRILLILYLWLFINIWLFWFKLRFQQSHDMLEAFTACWFTKSHLWRILFCLFTLRSNFERLSGLIRTEWFSHTQWDIDFWHSIVITNFHFIGINWHSIFSSSIIASRVVIFRMVNVNAINIFLMRNDSIVKVYRTCWSFALSVDVLQLVLKLARVQLLPILIKCRFIFILIVVVWLSKLRLILRRHSLEAPRCVEVLLTLLL